MGTPDAVRVAAGLGRLPGASCSGRSQGVPSVCTTNRWVIDAVLSATGARESNGPILIEATAGQIYPGGGYSGMGPAGFVDMVTSMAGEMGAAVPIFLTGGDHLGPHPWRQLPPEAAMAKAATLVEACVKAGMAKLHLDASAPCAGDPFGPDGLLPFEEAAKRCARLAVAAEGVRRQLPDAPEILYVVGTDVPAPGGFGGKISEAVTTPDGLDAAVSQTRQGFEAAGIPDAWERVIAVVVQSGVGFSNVSVADYRPEATAALCQRLEAYPGLVLEAHSTDFQTGQSLRRMVEDGFGILKVGPELTFAFREAVFSLAMIEKELFRGRKPFTTSRFMGVLERVMREDPGPWRAFYRCGGEPEPFLMRYALTDRCRYYWHRPAVADALDRLLANLGRRSIPFALISQFFPDQSAAVRTGETSGTPENLIRGRIQTVWRRYLSACSGRYSDC